MNEFNKLRNEKVALLLLAVLLLANIVFTAYSLLSSDEEEQILYSANKIVSEDPIVIKERYSELHKQAQDYKEAYDNWKLDPESPPPEPVIFPHTYNDSLDDYDFLSIYYQAIVTSEERSDAIENLIASSEKQLRNYLRSGYDTNNYSVRRLQAYISVYRAIDLNEESTDSPVFGWNEFFSYNSVVFFTSGAGILLGCCLFSLERRAGMSGILRASRHGRGRLAVRKMCFAIICALVLNILFFGSTLICIAVVKGFSSPFAALWQVHAFLKTPYSLNIFEAVLIRILLSSLVTLFYIFLAAFTETLTCRTIPAAATALSVFCAEYALYEGDGFFAVFNPLSILRFEDYFGQWKDISIVSYPLPALLFICLFFILLLPLAMLIAIFWSKRSSQGKSVRLHFRLPRAWRIGDTSIVKHEMRKVFDNTHILLLVGLLIADIVIDSNLYNGNLSFYDQRKQRYMEEYSALSLEEAEEVTALRLEQYSNVLSEDTIKQKSVDYLSKTITRDEYEQYLKDVAEAESHQNSLKAYNAELKYLIAKTKETGIQTEPVMDRGFNTIFENEFDILLFIAVVLVFSNICAREYETKFRSIQRCCAKGRSAIFWRKILLTLICSCVFMVCSFGIDLICVFRNYDMSLLSKPLMCSMRFASTSYNVSFGAYLLIIFGLRIFGALLLGMNVFSLSELTGSSLVTMFGSVSFLIPCLLRKMTVPVPIWLDLSQILSGDLLWETSMEQGSVLYLVIYTLPIFWVSVVGLFFARRKFVN